MIVQRVPEQFEPPRRRGIVFAAGGCADLILAQTGAPGNPPDPVLFPRRRKSKLIDKRLLCEVRVLPSEVDR